MLSTTWLKQHPLLTYLVLAYAISWIVAVPLALQAQGITHTHLPFTLHYFMAFGPAVGGSPRPLSACSSSRGQSRCLSAVGCGHA